MLSLCLAMVAFVGCTWAQDQCDPAEYQTCGASVKSIGYPKTCDSRAECRDCIGCNQACPFTPCNPGILCTSAQYIEAGQYIQTKQNQLGWLNLCCEASSPASKKCVGCQQANIFNILCGWVYPPLKAAMGFSAQSAPVNPDVYSASPWEELGAPKNSVPMGDDAMMMFGVQYMGIGAIIGILLTAIPLATIYCLCKQGVRTVHKYKKVSCLDSEDDAQRV